VKHGDGNARQLIGGPHPRYDGNEGDKKAEGGAFEQKDQYVRQMNGIYQEMGVDIEAHAENDPGEKTPADHEDRGKKTGEKNERNHPVHYSREKQVVDRVDSKGPEGVQFTIHLHDGDFRIDSGTRPKGDEKNRYKGGKFVDGKADEDVSQVLGQPESLQCLKDDAHGEGSEDNGNGDEKREDFDGGKVNLAKKDGTGGAVVSPGVKNIPQDPSGERDGLADGSRKLQGRLPDPGDRCDHGGLLTMQDSAPTGPFNPRPAEQRCRSLLFLCTGFSS